MIFACLVIFSLLHSSCNFLASCCDDCQDYIFELPWEMTSHDKIVPLGDTIVFESVFSDRVVDQSFGDTFTLKNYDVVPLFYLTKIDEPVSNNLDQYFEEVNIVADTSNLVVSTIGDGDVFYKLNYIYENSGYRLRLSFRTLKSGIYTLRVADEFVFRSLQDKAKPTNFEGRCKDRIQTVHFIAKNRRDIDEDWAVFESLRGSSQLLQATFKDMEQFEQSAGFMFTVE